MLVHVSGFASRKHLKPARDWSALKMDARACPGAAIATECCGAGVLDNVEIVGQRGALPYLHFHNVKLRSPWLPN